LTPVDLSPTFLYQNHLPLPSKIIHLRPCCGVTYFSIFGNPNRGEETASALERNLSKLERNLDALIASMESETETSGDKLGKSNAS
jgi:hypothetical protein